MATDFDRIVGSTTGTDRTAAVAAWFQGLFPTIDHAPVLVGGGAVELYTRGAYRTGDLDFVGRVTREVARRLEETGFERRGRHWIHEASRTFIECPATSFDAPVRLSEIRFGPWIVRVLSPEDVLVDRLASWKFWKSVPDGVNAFLVLRDRGEEMDVARLRERASKENVADALEAVRDVVERVPEGSEGIQEAERWARTVK